MYASDEHKCGAKVADDFAEERIHFVFVDGSYMMRSFGVEPARGKSDWRSACATGTLCDVHCAPANVASSFARRRELVLRRHGAKTATAAGVLGSDFLTLRLCAFA